MCGIIAVLRRQSRRAAPSRERLRALLAAGEGALTDAPTVDGITAAADELAALDRELRGVPGLWALLQDEGLIAELRERAEALHRRAYAVEAACDGAAAAGDDVERRNAELVRLKDQVWALRRDRAPHAMAVRDLAGGDVPDQRAAAAFSSIEAALAALDRLEVRGRDSAGVSIIVSGLDTESPTIQQLLAARDDDPLFQDGAVRCADGSLNFVYKLSLIHI